MLVGMIGIDEVGRGCWAGPLLVVAMRQTSEIPPHVTDSKLLSKSRREAIFDELSTYGTYGEGWVTPHEIDEIGLSGGMKLGVARALEAIKAQLTEQIIMDGSVNYCGERFSNVLTVIKADLHHPCVSAASIYAKVRRDTFMAEQSSNYPEYDFASHVGYGTQAHQRALEKYGPSPLHRLSYKPVMVQYELHRAR
jgi:ribonuclease HII